MMKKLTLVFIMIFSVMLSVGQNYYTVHVAQPPTLVTNAGTDITTCFYDSVQIGSTNVALGGEPPYIYSWFPTYGLSDPTIANPMALPDDTTTYTVTVTDANNCTSWSQMTVNIDPCAGLNKISYSFEFTVYPNPSTDGIFNVNLYGKRLYSSYKIRIINVFGQEVYNNDMQADEKSWTGILDLKHLNGGIYVLEITNIQHKHYQKIIIQ